MEKYYRCNKCGQVITKESSKLEICTSSVLMPARVICGGGFTVEISKEEVIDQFTKWNYTIEEIDNYFINN